MDFILSIFIKLYVIINSKESTVRILVEIHAHFQKNRERLKSLFDNLRKRVVLIRIIGT